MIRDKFKGILRKVAIKVLDMEFDTQDRPMQEQSKSTFDESKIPTVVDGSGDTPGPNHKENIGRTWVSAQLAGGVAPFLVDIRPPNEVVAGIIPSATIMSGNYIKEHTDQLPAKDQRVTIYDQTGDLGSDEIAQWLRSQGWILARRLQGGYAEWLEYDEPIEPPPSNPEAQMKMGDPVSIEQKHGFIHKVLTSQDKICYEVWVEDLGVIGIYSEEEVLRQ